MTNKRVISAVLPFGDTGTHRFHLRELKDGRAVLNIDAKYVLYLNPIAKVYLRLFIEKKSIKQIKKFISRNFSVKKDEIIEDYKDLMEKLRMILSEDAICPVHGIGLTPKAIEDNEFPLRVDFAITYNCNEKCSHCYIPENKLNKFPNELNTQEIKRVFDKLWDIGVPHIALTGGEATTRTDLLELLEYGQNKGFVMGVITNGRKFSDKKFVKEAIKSGLDYVQITLESNNPEIHDDMVGIIGAWEDTVRAIKNFAEEKIFWMTNTTICEKNVNTIPDTINFLHNLGAKVFAMNGLIYSGKGKKFPFAIDETEFKPILENILDISDNLGLRFIWYTVTQYCTINPIEMGLGVKRCSAANMSMGIEP
ncbi:MAG: radical SAM protein, partial [archaeon]|nr:radical SAM protein [archaeon]